MRKFNLVDGEMQEAEDGEFIRNDEAVLYMQQKIETLLVQLHALIAYLESLQ